MTLRRKRSKTERTILTAAATVLAALVLGLALHGCPKTGDEQSVEPPMAAPAGEERSEAPAPVQMASDPEALNSRMDDMKQAADDIIAGKKAAFEKGGDPEELYRQGVKEIMDAMQPEFGPANAWLFNERASKLAELCGALELDSDRCLEIEQSVVFGG